VNEFAGSNRHFPPQLESTVATFTELLPPTKSEPKGAAIDWTPSGEGPKSVRCARSVNAMCDSGDFWQAVERILTPQEVEAIALRFGEGMNTEEIGRRLGFRGAAKTLRAFASTLINDALKKLHQRRFDLRRAAGLA
jgi:predicted DNA-binding protein (UPF0251 family)